MVANAFFATTVIGMSLGLFLLQECQFLIPYRSLIVAKYGGAIGLYAALLFVNVFALIYSITRKVFLKDTGRKLSHLDKQLQVGQGELPAPSIGTIDGNDEELS